MRRNAAGAWTWLTERLHGEEEERRIGCDAAYGRITGAESVRQGSCDKEAGVIVNGVKVRIRHPCHSLPAAPPSLYHHAMSAYIRLSAT